MNATATVRKASRNDVPAIHSLLEHLADSTGLTDKFHSTEKQLLEHGFSALPMFETLVAEQHGKVVGLSLFFYTFSSWRGEPGVYVQDLVVDQATRSYGIGRMLMRATVRHAQQRHGATHLRLSVERDNKAAIRFYQRLGLRAAATEKIFETDQGAFEQLAVST